MHYANDKLVITGNNKISHMLRKTAADENIEVGPMDEKIDSINLDRMRAIAWVVDKLLSDDLGWEFYDLGYYYKLTKTKSCPYNAGLKLEVKISSSKVSSWHHCWTKITTCHGVRGVANARPGAHDCYRGGDVGLAGSTNRRQAIYGPKLSGQPEGAKRM
jgi:hypothetical protein